MTPHYKPRAPFSLTFSSFWIAGLTLPLRKQGVTKRKGKNLVALRIGSARQSPASFRPCFGLAADFLFLPGDTQPHFMPRSSGLSDILVSYHAIDSAINMPTLTRLVQHRLNQVIGNPDQVIQRA